MPACSTDTRTMPQQLVRCFSTCTPVVHVTPYTGARQDMSSSRHAWAPMPPLHLPLLLKQHCSLWFMNGCTQTTPPTMS